MSERANACVCVLGMTFRFSLIASGFRNSSTKWRRTLDLDRVGLVLSRGVKSKEDLKEDWELDEGEEKSDFWNPLGLLEDLKVKVCAQPVCVFVSVIN